MFKRLFLWALCALLLYQLWFFGHIVWWKTHNPNSTRFMAIRLSELQQRNPDAVLHHTWVEYEQISAHVKRAVIAAEDAKFLEHRGFDWNGMEKALVKNQQSGKRAAGGSTITQQLAKNLFLSPTKSYIRKAQEAVITLMIEACWSKRRILEVYLNVVEWGDGTFGVQAAAQRHYQINAAQLSATQAARMVVMLPSPRKFERRLPDYAVRYSYVVLKRMPLTAIP